MVTSEMCRVSEGSSWVNLGVNRVLHQKPQMSQIHQQTIYLPSSTETWKKCAASQKWSVSSKSNFYLITATNTLEKMRLLLWKKIVSVSGFHTSYIHSTSTWWLLVDELHEFVLCPMQTTGDHSSLLVTSPYTSFCEHFSLRTSDHQEVTDWYLDLCDWGLHLDML